MTGVLTVIDMLGNTISQLREELAQRDHMIEQLREALDAVQQKAVDHD